MLGKGLNRVWHGKLRGEGPGAATMGGWGLLLGLVGSYYWLDGGHKNIPACVTFLLTPFFTTGAMTVTIGSELLFPAPWLASSP